MSTLIHKLFLSPAANIVAEQQLNRSLNDFDFGWFCKHLLIFEALSTEHWSLVSSTESKLDSGLDSADVNILPFISLKKKIVFRVKWRAGNCDSGHQVGGIVQSMTTWTRTINHFLSLFSNNFLSFLAYWQTVWLLEESDLWYCLFI